MRKTGDKLLIATIVVAVVAVVSWVVVTTPANNAIEHDGKIESTNAPAPSRTVFCNATCGGSSWQVYTQSGSAYVSMGSVAFLLAERWSDDVGNQFASGGKQGQFAVVFTLVGGAESGVACLTVGIDGNKVDQWGKANSSNAEERAAYDIAAAAIHAYDSR